MKRKITAKTIGKNGARVTFFADTECRRCHGLGVVPVMIGRMKYEKSCECVCRVNTDTSLIKVVGG